ncbi:hypothetical protein TrispH2_010897 [Trichoplax sp. H2]|nr:hypothetical protein TrispH2_010897 [Trichoplax sp. H2]|eukprot:RDD36847.1 hypothetical protein TrispH2_010897 [Trichoplax sp. H2]
MASIISIDYNDSTNNPLLSMTNTTDSITASILALTISTVRSSATTVPTTITIAATTNPPPLDMRTFIVVAVISVLGLYLNLVATIALFIKPALKKHPFYQFLASIGITTLLAIINPISGSLVLFLNSRGIIPLNNFSIYSRIFIVAPSYCSFIVTMHTLNWIAIERCYESFRYPKRFSDKYIKLLIVLAWIIAVAFTVPIAIYTHCTNHTAPCNTYNHILTPHKPFWISFLALNYFIPVLSLGVCYAILMKFQCGKTIVASFEILEKKREEKKFIKLCFLTTLIYTACLTPRCILILTSVTYQNKLNASSAGIIGADRILSMLYLILLPLIYIIFNQDIRQTYCPCCHQSAVMPDNIEGDNNTASEKAIGVPEKDDDSL